MPQPPGKIKEVYESQHGMEPDDIRTALTGSIGVLLVLADGVDACSPGVFSSDHAMAYALFSTCHTLSDIDRRAGAGPRREGEAAVSA